MKINQNIEFYFTSYNGKDFYPMLSGFEQQDRIPLLLTYGQMELANERISELDFKDFSFEYIKMIISGCIMFILQRHNI
jgi:hypothetical protein